MTFDPRCDMRWPLWSPDKLYRAHYAVCHNGQCYRSKVENQGVTPSEGETWALVGGGASGPSGPVDWNTGITNKPSVFPPDVTNLATQAELDAFASSVASALTGKSDTSHNHSGLYSPANHNHDAAYSGIGHAHSGIYAPAVHNHDALYAPINHTHPGGSDAWTYLKVSSADFTTSSATAVDITGLGFTPLPNTWYEFHGMLLLRTATATVNPRAGLAWATGLTDGIARIEEAQAAGTAPLNANGNIAASLLIAVGGLPNTAQSWPATVWGSFRSGASPSGSVRLQLASETAGTVVRATIGSFLRYRIIP